MTLFLSSSNSNERKCILNYKRNRCPSGKKNPDIRSSRHSHNLLSTYSWPGTIKNFTIIILILIRPWMGISPIFQMRTLKLDTARTFFQLKQLIGGLVRLTIQVDMTKKSCSYFLQIISQPMNCGTPILWDNKLLCLE